jgi:hypothetical protein
MAVETAYDKYFKVAEKNILKGIHEDDGLLGGYLSKEIEKWEDTCLTELDGMSPRQLLGNIDNFVDIMALFKLGAVMCDDTLPTVFLSKLKSFGTIARDTLLDLCSKPITKDISEEDFQISQLAIQILGIWQVELAVEPLIELLFRGTCETELLFENVKESLVNIGKPAIPALIQNIEKDGFKSEAGDYMLMALADIGENNKTDVIYKCLKNAFTVMQDKSIGAFCLGNYGDGRAIPALRGFLEKNKENIDKEIFYDIISAINRLGGNTEDLSN